MDRARVALVLVLLILLLFVGLAWKVQEDYVSGRQYDLRWKEPNIPIKPDGKKRLLLVGGVHGNEPAGTVALEAWSQMGIAEPTDWEVIILPRANPYGLDRGRRENGSWINTDTNRNFTEDGPVGDQAETINALVQTSDLVMDFHEGWGFHIMQPASIGSTITSNDSPGVQKIAEAIVSTLNSTIPDSGKQFTHLVDNACDITTTLGCHCQRLRVPYLLMETTGQNNVQAMDIRVRQIHQALAELYKQLQ